MDEELKEFWRLKLYRYTATRKDGTVEHGELYAQNISQVGIYLQREGYRDIDVYTVIDI